MIHRAARFYLFTNRSDNFLPETQIKCEKIELLLTTSRLKDTGHLTVDQQATKKLKKQQFLSVGYAHIVYFFCRLLLPVNRGRSRMLLPPTGLECDPILMK